MDLTTAGLIDDVKLSALLPDGMFEDTDIISFLNDGYYSEVLPFMMRHREDFYVTYTDFDPAATIEIPTDAIAQKLKDVQVKNGEHYSNLPRLTMGEITAQTGSWGGPTGFYIQDNTIVFYPRAQTNIIRLVYYARPIFMTDSGVADNCFTILSVHPTDEPANVVVDRSFTDNAIITGEDSLTLTKGYQPFNVDTVQTISHSIGTDQVKMSEADVLKCTVGDVLSVSANRTFPKIPIEARDILVQAAIVKAMTSMKDKEGYGIAVSTLKEAKKNISGLLSPRVDNEVKKIVNTSSAIWNNRNGWRK